MPSRAQRLEPHRSVQSKRAEGCKGEGRRTCSGLSHTARTQVPVTRLRLALPVESHLSRAAPQSLWKGGRGPSGVRRQVRRAPERLGRQNASTRRVPAPAWPSPAPLHQPSGGRLQGPTHVGPSGWDGGAVSQPRGGRPDSDGRQHICSPTSRHPSPGGPTPSRTLGLTCLSGTHSAASSEGQSLSACFSRNPCETPLSRSAASDAKRRGGEAQGEVSLHLPRPPARPPDAGRERWPQTAQGCGDRG